MTLTKTLALCIPLAAMLAGCAEKKSPAPPPAPAPTTPLSGTVAEETTTATATVRKVDQKTRHVTLKGSDGKDFVIVAGPEVQNLPQVKKGDVVTLTYKESIGYEVVKSGKGKPGASVTTDITHAPLGEKPAGTVTNSVTARVTIAAIDKAAGTVTLRDSKGNMTPVKVKDPSKLDHVKVGDMIDITYTEALAAKVEKASKKK